MTAMIKSITARLALADEPVALACGHLRGFAESILEDNK